MKVIVLARTTTSLLFVVFSSYFLQLFAQITPTVGRAAIVHAKFRTPTSDGIPTETNAQTTIQYFDGLGNLKQSVGYRQSPSSKDVIQSVATYDKQLRPSKSYLPFPATSNTGAYNIDPQATASAFYEDVVPYEEVIAYDNSVLDRPRVTRGAGMAWQTNNRVKRTKPEFVTMLKSMNVDGAGNIVFSSGFLSSGEFWPESTWDEHDSQTVTIIDKSGKKIVVRDANSNDTYYVYDARDRLYAVIQPQGYDFTSTGITKNSATWQNYVFAYEYDLRNRIIRKHIPSGGWTSYVYDKADRVVLEQTALQATTNHWSFTKYDVLGREIIKGELVNANAQATLQSNFDGVSTPYEVWQGSAYSSQSFPIAYTASDEKTINYYDQYDWRPTALAFDATSAYNAATYWSNAKGLLTGSRVQDPQTNTLYYDNVIYYDNRNRILQTFQTHHKGGSSPQTKPIITNYEYNFAGEVTKEKVLYQVDGQANTEALTWNEYDHVGRLLKIYHGINSSTPTEIVRLSYDEAGRLQQKKLLPNGTYYVGGIPEYINRPPSPTIGIDDVAKKAVCLQPGTEITNTYSATIDPNSATGTPIDGLQTMDYRWHIRGGLLGINLDGSGNPTPNAAQGDLFSFKLDYETANQWDGNIGKQSWKNNTEGQRSYTYTYDPTKRLTAATYTGVNGEDFSLPQITYDKNGNIGTLQRKGSLGSSYDFIDNLTYHYGTSGNRLQGVTDAVTGNLDVGDFRDNGSNSDYTYWADGSLKSDANKGISLIEYDTFLKRVKQVTWSDGKWLKFFYDGSGKLLKRQNSAGDVWEYVGGMIFKNGQPYQLSTPEGRAVYAGGLWNYEFEYRDVWGSLRQSFAAEGNQLVSKQKADYDAFGYEFNKAAATPANYFKYQKQERIEDFGVGIDFFKFRPSDFIIGRFWQIDPLAEKYAYNSPYALQENKFGLGIELEGAEILTFADLQVMYNDVKSWWNEPLSKEASEAATDLAKNNFPSSNIRVTTKGAAVMQVVSAFGSAMQDANGFRSVYNSKSTRSVNIKARAAAIQNSQSSEIARNKSTTAVAEVVNSDGSSSIVVASSRNRLTPAQRAALKKGEVEIRGEGHAEATIIEHAQSNSLEVKRIAASRPICENCQQSISTTNANVESEIKKPKVINQN